MGGIAATPHWCQEIPGLQWRARSSHRAHLLQGCWGPLCLRREEELKVMTSWPHPHPLIASAVGTREPYSSHLCPPCPSGCWWLWGPMNGCDVVQLRRVSSLPIPVLPTAVSQAAISFILDRNHFFPLLSQDWGRWDNLLHLELNTAPKCPQRGTRDDVSQGCRVKGTVRSCHWAARWEMSEGWSPAGVGLGEVAIKGVGREK